MATSSRGQCGQGGAEQIPLGDGAVDAVRRMAALAHVRTIGQLSARYDRLMAERNGAPIA